MYWIESYLSSSHSAISQHSLILAIIIIFIYSNKHLWAVLITASCHLGSHSSYYWQNFAKPILHFSSALTSPTWLNNPHDIFWELKKRKKRILLIDIRALKSFPDVMSANYTEQYSSRCFHEQRSRISQWGLDEKY